MQYLYPLLTVMIWAGNNVITKAAAGRIFPAEIGFYRWLLAGLLFTPFLLGPVLRNRAAIKPIMGKVAILGVLGMAIYQSLAYYAANITTATNMGIILSLVPVMTLGMSIASLGTALTAGALVGALVSFAGVLLVVSQGSWAVLVAHGVNLGDLMMLVATLAYATYSTLLKKWQLRMPPLQLLYLQILVAIIALFPLFAPEFWHRHFGKASAFWALAFLVPFTIAFGFELALYELVHVALLEYIPFIILLFSLFTVAGGVRVTGRLKGTPAVNTAILPEFGGSNLGVPAGEIQGLTGQGVPGQ